MDGGAWQAAVRGVARSQTQLSGLTFIFTVMHWRRKWQPTPVFLPGESQGRWSLVGCCLWGRTESDRLTRLSSSGGSSSSSSLLGKTKTSYLSASWILVQTLQEAAPNIFCEKPSPGPKQGFWGSPSFYQIAPFHRSQQSLKPQSLVLGNMQSNP